MLSEEDKTWITDLLATFTTQQLFRFATREDLAKFATREDLERVETRLLTGFHKWASPAEARQRGTLELLHAVDLEVKALKDGVALLESKQT